MYIYIFSFFQLVDPPFNPYAILNNIPQQVRIFQKDSPLKAYLAVKLPEQGILTRSDFYLNEVKNGQCCHVYRKLFLFLLSSSSF